MSGKWKRGGGPYNRRKVGCEEEEIIRATSRPEKKRSERGKNPQIEPNSGREKKQV